MTDLFTMCDKCIDGVIHSMEAEGQERSSLTSIDILYDHYFVTYKYNKGKPESVTASSYAGPIHLLEYKGKVVDYAFEKDSKGRLHYHCIFKARKNLLLRQFNRAGFSLKIKTIYNYEKLQDYLRKVEKTKKIDNKIFMF